MVDFVINNNIVSPRAVTTSNFDSVLTLIRSQIESVSSDLLDVLSQNIPSGSITNTAGGISVQLPQLADILAGQSSFVVNTTTPIIGDTDLNLVIQNTNITLNPAGLPVLTVTGLINQPLAETGTTTQQPFTADIPIPTANGTAVVNSTTPVTSATTTTTASQILNTTDSVTTTALPNNQVTATANNLTQNVTTVLPQNLSGINLSIQNSLNIQIVALAPPSSDENFVEDTDSIEIKAVAPTVDLDIEGNTPQRQPTVQTPAAAPILANLQNAEIESVEGLSRVITGVVQNDPNTNEAVINTQYGTFRIPNISNIPNGTTISFTIQGEAATPLQSADEILELNPTNIQTLKLALESSNSPIQNLLKLLNSTPTLSAQLQSLFPKPDDKDAYSKQLLFASAASKGSSESWLGDDNTAALKNTANADANLNRLQDVFSTMKNFTGHNTQQAVNTDWNSYVIPFYDGSKLSFMTVQTQRDPEGDSQQNQTTKGKRKFVLELDQDDLGRVAIEGLYSKFDAKVKDLDLVIKTDNEVSDSFKQELTDIYTQTASAYGFAGSLTFSNFNGTSMPVYADISKILGDGIVI